MSSQNQQINIVNEDLNDNFYKSSYFGIDIIIHRKSNYISGTKLQFAMNSKKKFYHWAGKNSKTGKYLRKETGELLKAVSKQTKIPVKDLIKDFTNISGPNYKQISGQYIHKYLVNALAMYYSVEYSVQVSILLTNLNDKLLEEERKIIEAEKNAIDGEKKKITRKYTRLCKKFKNKMDRLDEKEVEIKELVDGMEEVKQDNIKKEDKIDKLLKELSIFREESRKKHEESDKKLDRVLDQNDDLKDKADDLKDKADNLEDKVDNLADKADRADNKLNSLVKSVVPKAQQIKLHEQFAMYEINDPTSKYSCQ